MGAPAKEGKYRSPLVGLVAMVACVLHSLADVEQPQIWCELWLW